MTARTAPPTDLARALVGVWALTATAAAIAALAPGLAPALRSWFAFAPAETHRDLVHASEAFLANLRVVGFVLLGALAARERRVRALLDALVLTVVGASVALVGLALGAYGPVLGPWLVHVPLEWAALAIALAAYLQSRRTPFCLPDLLRAGGLAAVVLALAAVVEVWATPVPSP